MLGVPEEAGRLVVYLSSEYILLFTLISHQPCQLIQEAACDSWAMYCNFHFRAVRFLQVPEAKSPVPNSGTAFRKTSPTRNLPGAGAVRPLLAAATMFLNWRPKEVLSAG
jgi:hypothetical protein